MRYFVLQVPKVLELVGLGYTAWFVYRYLLFKVRIGSMVVAAWTTETLSMLPISNYK